MPTLTADPALDHLSDADRSVPVWQPDPRAAQDRATQDYLFDLHGFTILRGALDDRDLAEINAFVDAHPAESLEPGQWIGDVETHRYGVSDGINFQNIIEGGPVFERLIDHPAWYERVKRYIENGAHHLTIDENFLNVRQSGGFIPMHSGGNTVRFTSCFRNYAGRWMVGQINVLMALADTGYGDGCTTVIPGSHRVVEDHPEDRHPDGHAYGRGVPASQAAGMVQVHLKAGDALMFTDALTHGSMPRMNPGERRVMIYRYAPHLMAKRFNYIPSPELLARLTDRRCAMVQSQPPRMRPGRVIEFKHDDGPREFQGQRI
ncbi:MAG: phytanoyl-CoA dioxygenase family protein [Planctomycetota bacterium]